MKFELGNECVIEPQWGRLERIEIITSVRVICLTYPFIDIQRKSGSLGNDLNVAFAGEYTAPDYLQ